MDCERHVTISFVFCVPLIGHLPSFPVPPYVPILTSLITDLDELTVTLTSVPTATIYSVSINDSDNTVINMHMYTFTGLTNNTVNTVSVVAINCAGSSSPATITGRTGISKSHVYSNLLVKLDHDCM